MALERKCHDSAFSILELKNNHFTSPLVDTWIEEMPLNPIGLFAKKTSRSDYFSIADVGGKLFIVNC